MPGLSQNFQDSGAAIMAKKTPLLLVRISDRTPLHAMQRHSFAPKKFLVQIGTAKYAIWRTHELLEVCIYLVRCRVGAPFPRRLSPPVTAS